MTRHWRLTLAAAFAAMLLTVTGCTGSSAKAGTPGGAPVVSGTTADRDSAAGIAFVNELQSSQITSVSCTSPGNCGAGGSYTPDDPTKTQAFVVSEVNGVWRPARQVPGPGALPKSRYLSVASLSCASAQYCAGGGFYSNGQTNRLHGRNSGHEIEAFVFST